MGVSGRRHPRCLRLTPGRGTLYPIAVFVLPGYSPYRLNAWIVKEGHAPFQGRAEPSARGPTSLEY